MAVFRVTLCDALDDSDPAFRVSYCTRFTQKNQRALISGGSTTARIQRSSQGRALYLMCFGASAAIRRQLNSDHSPALLAVLKPAALHSEGRAAVWAYGSRVRHTARPHPDLDPVVFTSPAQRWSVGELKEALSESDLPFAVDLHVWDEVPERFHEIRKECGLAGSASATGHLILLSLVRPPSPSLRVVVASPPDRRGESSCY